MNTDNLKKFLDTEVYKDLREYLAIKIDYFDRLSNVKDLPKAQDQAVEVKAHRKANDYLQEMLDELGIEVLDGESLEEKIAKKKNELGL